jgi:hypothetical protein
MAIPDEWLTLKSRQRKCVPITTHYPVAPHVHLSCSGDLAIRRRWRIVMRSVQKMSPGAGSEKEEAVEPNIWTYNQSHEYGIPVCEDDMKSAL